MALITVLLLLNYASVASSDDLVLFVHPQSKIKEISKSQIINIYMGKYNEFPSGHKVNPLDTQTYKSQFYRQLIKKSIPQLNAYWSRIKFTGRAENKPDLVAEPALVLNKISQDKTTIGYLPRHLVKGEYRIVYEFN